MKRRSFYSLLIGAVLVLLATGAAGAVWLTSHSPLRLFQGGDRATPTATLFLPRQPPLALSLLVNPDELEAFRLATAGIGQRRQAREELEEFHRSLLNRAGLNYEQDVRPWVGDEMTLAVTTADQDRDAANGWQPGYLLAIATKDPQRSRDFLQVFWQRQAVAGVDLVFEQYAGAQIIYGQSNGQKDGQKDGQNNGQNSEPNAGVSTALVGDRFVLFANTPRVIREALTNAQVADLNLSAATAYQQGLAQLTPRRIATAYAHLPSLGAWLDQSLGTPSLMKPPGLGGLYDSVAIALQPDQGGLVADVALLPAPGKTLPSSLAHLAAPVEPLRLMPSSTPLVAAGLDLNAFWQQVLTGLGGYDALPRLIQQPLQEVQQRWGINLQEDVFPWVKGEYTLAWLPNPAGALEWIFATERSPDTTRGIERLNTIARQQGLSIGPITLEQQPVLAWTKLSTPPPQGKSKALPVSTTSLQAKVQGLHTALGNYEVFATSVDAMDQVLNSGKHSLLEEDGFQRAIAALDRPNDGYLYLNWPALKQDLEAKIPLVRLVELSARPLFNHLRSLTLTSYGVQQGIQRSAAFLRLQRV